VLYYAALDAETATALRGTELADNLARLTGLVVERRAEGVMLVDPTGRFTDQPFPGRGGAVNRTAGLLLAKIADLTEDPDAGQALTRISVPSVADDLREVLERIDAGAASGAGGQDRAGSPDAQAAEGHGPGAGLVPLEAPFVERTRLEGMLAELFNEFGAASFTAQWQYDPHGLLDAAMRLLCDLRLLRQLPGGALILPAAARYRNITAALPGSGKRDGQGMFDFTTLATGGSA
jgi:hypothetical protein